MLKSIREITNQLDNTDRCIRQQRRDFLQLKDSLCDLHAKKKKLVDSYNRKRTEYIDWSNRNKKDMQCSPIICSNYPYPATYPAAYRHRSCEFYLLLLKSVFVSSLQIIYKPYTVLSYHCSDTITVLNGSVSS